MRDRRSAALGIAALAGVCALLAACSNPRAWYRVDDYPGFTVRPLIDFEEHIEYPKDVPGGGGAPPRMLRFNRELNVQCVYCHIDADAITGGLTSAGTASRRDMDLADRFKVSCDYCHAQSPTKFTRAGKFSQRDMRIPERRWACATCHDVGFKVTRR
jgi:hypothetical protein